MIATDTLRYPEEKPRSQLENSRSASIGNFASQEPAPFAQPVSLTRGMSSIAPDPDFVSQKNTGIGIGLTGSAPEPRFLCENGVLSCPTDK